MFVHHCNLTHRAGKNTDRQRRAIGIVFIPKSCGKDLRLEKHSHNMLKEDIELQKVKNALLYEKLRNDHDYLF
jgi:ectoine hydroxylase-related dioxygenase (phytanoyl-CoA dioxygenase family)